MAVRSSLKRCAAALVFAVAPVALGDNYGSAILTDQPTGYWRFNETSGSTLGDVSGHNNNAFYQSDASSFAIAQPGFLPSSTNHATSFNGGSVFGPYNLNSAAMSQDNSPALNPFAYADSFTIEGWVRDRSPEPTGDFDPNNGSRFFFGNNFGFGLTELNEPHFVSFSRKDYILNSVHVSQDQWHQMAVTFNGTDAVFYLDGENVGTKNVGHSLPGAAQSETQFGIGRRTTAQSPWLGDIDELSIFDKVLNDDQIRLHYLAALSEFGDANGDKQIDFADLVAVAQHYGQSASSFADGDFDGDGSVSFPDLVTVAQHYGSTIGVPPAAATAVPEPALMPAMGAGILMLARRRLRR